MRCKRPVRHQNHTFPQPGTAGCGNRLRPGLSGPTQTGVTVRVNAWLISVLDYCGCVRRRATDDCLSQRPRSGRRLQCIGRPNRREMAVEPPIRQLTFVGKCETAQMSGFFTVSRRAATIAWLSPCYDASFFLARLMHVSCQASDGWQPPPIVCLCQGFFISSMEVFV